MTTPTIEPPTDLDTLLQIVEQAAEAVELEPGKIYAFKLGERVHQVDLTGDAYRDLPKRKTGHVLVRDVPSFLAYHAKHGDDGTEIYADREQRTITAVLDAHDADSPRWGQHRVTLGLHHTDSFQAWFAANGRLMPQVTFAEFIEDHRSDITSPPAADLLELAQSFQATTKVTFRSGTRLKSGQRQLQYVEEQTAGGGASGDLVVPDEFSLAVAVFEGATVADSLTARLRYRIADGKLGMLFILDRLDEVVDAAFEGVVGDVAAGVKTPILRGMPA